MIGEAVYYLPYMIISLSLIIGIIVFIFIYIGKYGAIALGVFVAIILSLVILGKIIFYKMDKTYGKREEREAIERNAFKYLLKLSFERVMDYTFSYLVQAKDKEIHNLRSITLSYIGGQSISESFAVVTTIILLSLLYNHVDENILTNTNVFICFNFLTASFYPFKFAVYGYFTMVRALHAFMTLRN